MIKTLTSEIEDYSKYEKNQLIFIQDKKDYRVKDVMSFTEWVKRWKDYDSIKVEGLPHSIVPDLGLKKINSVHLFVNNKGGYSFDKHCDDTNVALFCVKGHKRVHIYEKKDDELGIIHQLYKDHPMFIKKGVYHEVNSERDSWALSIGYD